MTARVMGRMAETSVIWFDHKATKRLVFRMRAACRFPSPNRSQRHCSRTGAPLLRIYRRNPAEIPVRARELTEGGNCAPRAACGCRYRVKSAKSHGPKRFVTVKRATIG